MIILLKENPPSVGRSHWSCSAAALTRKVVNCLVLVVYLPPWGSLFVKFKRPSSRDDLLVSARRVSLRLGAACASITFTPQVSVNCPHSNKLPFYGTSEKDVIRSDFWSSLNLGPNHVREHLISSQFFSKRNAFQIGFTPSLPPLSERLIAHFLTNNRRRPSSRPRLSTTKLLRASLLSFSSREASADNIISTSSSFSPFPVSLHASSALRLASTRGRPGLQAT